jgi:thiol:disulfide interchange protein DsbD
MSVPLLLVGASAGALLPRAGAWMVEVKMVFGVLLLGVALWTVQPVLARPLALALWGVLALGTAAVIYSRGRAAAPATPSSNGTALPSRLAWRGAVAALFALLGVVEIVGAAAGGTDPLQPLAPFTSRGGVANASSTLQFTAVRSSEELDATLRNNSTRPVLLDFYADWCVSCKEMEQFTFGDTAVQQRMAGALLLRADVTANSAQDRALLRRFHLFGPPAMIFFDRGGREIGAARLVGFQKSARFLETLQSAGL